MRLTLPRRRRDRGPLTGHPPGGGHGLSSNTPRMVPDMRQRIAMLGVLAGLVAGLGCHHVGGKCDCGAHPSDAVMTPPTPPYAVSPAPGTQAKPLPLTLILSITSTYP